MNIPYGPLLVVEDIPNILELLEVTLRFKGYPVNTAANGQEALEAIRRERPALVITDILMPKMDGFALAHRLRCDPKTSQIPVIFLSATFVTPEDKAAASAQAGSETGSEFGLAEGMEGGVEGGVVGGTLGGVLGGVIGGTGTGPVLDYDMPPRQIRTCKPQYPQEAFVKKVEGTVLLEILIDANGRVVRARVLQSIPSLDAAAVQTAYQCVFTPAMKHGRPVATVGHMPVTFRIF